MHSEKVMKVHNLLASAGCAGADGGSFTSKKSIDIAMKKISCEVVALKDSLMQSGAISEDLMKDIDGIITYDAREEWRKSLRNFLQKKILYGFDANYVANLPTKIAFLVVGGCANFAL